MAAMYTLSHAALDAILRQHGLKPNDLAGIDKLFGGADGYYWYHTLRHLCPKGETMTWASLDELRSAVQGHENMTAEEDEVKPQQLQDAHVAAIAGLLRAQ